MVTTNFLVKKRKISQIDSIPYTGEDNIDTFKFEFDEEWEGLDKTLVIVSGNNRYNIALLHDQCVVPFEFYQIKGNVLIGLFGTDGTYQTLATGWLPIYVEEDSYEVGVEPDNLPTQTQWDAFVTEINNLLEQAEASEEHCAEILEQIEELKSTIESYMSTIEGYKDTTKGYMDTTEGYKNDVNTTITNFNNNVEQKTTDFNTNATNKTNAFNLNASDKTTAFDNNATSKTTTFDNNATAKTTAFNENYTAKLNEFNKNAEERTTEFNKNTEQLYKDIEALESLAPISIEAGTTIDIDNAKAYKMMGEVVDGKYQQDATPSPENPQEITQINSAVLNRCGKNMANPMSISWTYNGITIEKLGKDRYRLNGTSTGAFDYTIFGNRKIYLTKDKYYRLSRIVWSGTTTGVGLSNCRLITPTTSTLAWLRSDNLLAKKAPENSYIDLIVLAIGNNVTFTNYVFSVQLEEVENANSPATSYEAYNGQSINIDLSGNEVCALSDIIKDQLIIDKNGNVALQKNVAKLVLDGSEDWQISPKYNCFCYFPGFTMNMRSVNSISNIFREKSISQIKDNANFGMYTKYTSLLLIGYPNITLEEFKTFLNNNNLVLYYCMNEPQIIELPKLTEIPTMLDEINHVWVETNIGLINIEIKYVEDLQREIEKLKTAIVALGGV